MFWISRTDRDRNINVIETVKEIEDKMNEYIQSGDLITTLKVFSWEGESLWTELGVLKYKLQIYSSMPPYLVELDN